MNVLNNLKPEEILKHTFNESESDFSAIFETGEITINSDNEKENNINLSTILTKLIQETGRFVERFASDLIIDWDNVRHAIDNENEETQYFAFGLRKDGVDSGTYITANMQHHWNSEHYRRIYCVAISHSDGNKVTVELRDIQSEINMLAYRMQNERDFNR